MRRQGWATGRTAGGLLAGIATMLCAAPAASAQTTFLHTGTEQTYLVPAGVTQLRIVAIGGRGGNSEAVSGGSPSRAGGQGATVEGVVDVTPGETLVVVVGGNGSQTAGGFNGGAFSIPILNGLFASQPGGGGGASDVRRVFCDSACPGTAASLASRIIVAGGGGGAGANGNHSGESYNGRNGGRGARAGGDGEGNATPLLGGSGGERGRSDRGGVGGDNTPQNEGRQFIGRDGALGKGGTGGQGENSGGAGAGGGGGGGLYGGGGGSGAADAWDYPVGGGGGGGGSSLVPAGGTLTFADPVEQPSVTITPLDAGPGDTTPPDTEITGGPAEGATILEREPEFSFTSTEDGSTFECSLDGGGWAPCTSPITLGPLADGPYTFEVRAIDPAANIDPSPASRSFTVDADIEPGGDAYAELVGGDEPVGYWRLGEASGTTAVDSSPNGNDGTYAGGPALGQAGALTGDDDTAARLDGADDVVRVPHAASLDVGSSLTAEAWIRRTVAGGASHQLLLKGSRGLQLVVMGAGTGNEIWLRKAGVTTIARSSSGVPADGAFHHVVATMDGPGTARLYLDGADVTVPVPGQHVQALQDSALPLFLGGTGTTPYLLDEVALYDRALTAEEVAAHHAAATAPVP